MDPEFGVLGDASHPLIFYAVDDAAATIRLAKTPALEIGVHY